MRKKIICLLSILMIFSTQANADDINSGASWEEIMKMENAWDGQKKIKNSDYEKVIEELEKRKNAKKIKEQKKAGQALMKQEEGGGELDYLSSFAEQYPLLNLTVPIIINNVEIPVGHYKVVGKKDGNNVILNLCQSYNVVARISAIETNDDFDEKEINFVKVEVVNDKVLKLKYGSMQFNAYAYVSY